ncbi:MAG: hypothetical protein Q9219_003202 [cf. Caloplaca sp. 3 TL-2023]
MCLPYLIEIKPSPRRKPDCARPVPKKAGLTPPLKCSPPPCIITIEPRSPRPPKAECSPGKKSIHVRGEASPRGLALKIEREEECNKEQQPPKQGKSSQIPTPNPPPCRSPKRERSNSPSSSSSSVSTTSFRKLQERVEEYILRLTNLEKEFQNDRSKANRNLWAAAGRDDKIERELCGLRDTVGGMNKEIEVVRKDVWHLRRREDVALQEQDRDNERRVRVRWEKTKEWPRGMSY